MEIWNDVKGYEGLYLVSDLGRIKSLPKKTRKGDMILVPQLGNNGYYSVDLCKSGSIKRVLIHRLVCFAFLENPKDQVNHKDGNKLNNELINLEWSTRSENQLHSIRAGLRTTKGTKNSQSKLNESDVLAIREKIKKHYRVRDLSLEYNISPSTICDIYKRRSWTHI